MIASNYKNAEGDLLTVIQACEIFNLGRATVTRLAKESHSYVKIGKSVRIIRKKFFDYIEATYVV